jgi:SAM-dependent methyltransferase
MGQLTSDVLDLGCGRDKLPGALGMDSNPASDADVIHDLDVFPWPLADNTFSRVRAQDVLEHVSDFFRVMEELHRVCRDGAIIEVRMPFMSSVNYATDPSHRRAGTAQTFDYFDQSKELGRYRYSPVRFDVLEFRYGRGYFGLPGRVMSLADKVLLPLMHREHRIYEHYFAYVYPVHEINYRLRVRK